MNITKDTFREVHTHTRGIHFEGREPELVTGYSFRGKQWIPEYAEASWKHGDAIKTITMWGQVLKKDGTPGANKVEATYATPAHNGWDSRWNTNAPEWLLELFADSPHTTLEES